MDRNKITKLLVMALSFLKAHPFASLRFIAGNIMAALVQVACIGSLYPIISRVIMQEDSSSAIIRYYDAALKLLGLRVSLFSYLLLFGLSAVLSFLIYALVEVDKAGFLRNFETRMRLSLLEKVVYSPWSSLRKINHGEFINAVSNEADSYRVVVFYVFAIITTCIQIIAFSYFIFRINLSFAVASYLLLLVGFVIFMPVMKASSRMGHESTDIYTRLTDSLVNICRSFKNIKAGSLEGFLLGRIKPIVEELSQLFYRQQINLNIFHAKLYELVGYFILALLLFTGVQLMRIDKAQVIIILAFLIRLVPMVTSLSDQLSRALGHLPSLSRIQKIKDESQGKLAPETRNLSLNQPLTSIRFKNVSFQYGKERSLFKDLSLEFKKGEFWAICGPTGSGKTTILDLISGISDFSSGGIIYNEIDSKEIRLESLHQKINYLTQHNFIFAGTILENICWGNQEPDLAILDEVLKLSRLDELVKQKTLGFRVAESGQNLSVGEQQRISIARALLEKCDFILMDEPTSALDEKTEQEFLSSLASLKGKVGIIMVTHKKEYLKYVDHILQLNGRGFEVLNKTIIG